MQGTHHHLLPLPELRLASACVNDDATASRKSVVQADRARAISGDRLPAQVRSGQSSAVRCPLSAATAAGTVGRCPDSLSAQLAVVSARASRAPVQKRWQHTGGGGGGAAGRGRALRPARRPPISDCAPQQGGGACSGRRAAPRAQSPTL